MEDEKKKRFNEQRRSLKLQRLCKNFEEVKNIPDLENIEEDEKFPDLVNFKRS